MSAVQNRGYKVALLTDGQLSGVCSKIPPAIHGTPETKDGAFVVKVRDRGLLRLGAVHEC
ncbi:dihydroxy-acid dehydratase [Pseudovibrio axinellae]|uniref:dihydroxy-acid dehydratase n=1 Tax=Pseudovibrio axinellae TaxID=989403 RepID=UPI00094286F5